MQTPDQRNLILVINPGGTSTRVAIFGRGNAPLHELSLRHDSKELLAFDTVLDQLPMRSAAVKNWLSQTGVELSSLQAVVGRGGPVAPMRSGVYAATDQLLKRIHNGPVIVQHPSLLGVPIARTIADRAGCPAFFVDPVTVDELCDEARLTGLPELPRAPLSHALSIRAAAREAAHRLSYQFETARLIVAHLGSGFTIAAFRDGIGIDHNDATASGPIAPTRAGALSTIPLITWCLEQGLSISEIERRLVKTGGWTAHLGTDDIREIYSRIDRGDTLSQKVIDATLYQLNREIGGLFAVLQGCVDALVLTGGLTRSERFVTELKTLLPWFNAPIFVISDDLEMRALADGARRALTQPSIVINPDPYLI
jgi:butyrate kinase